VFDDRTGGRRSVPAQLAARAIGCIDAPMSGGPEVRAQHDELMVACADGLFDRSAAAANAGVALVRVARGLRRRAHQAVNTAWRPINLAARPRRWRWPAGRLDRRPRCR